IDINIHPTKTEIKFDDEHSLYAILRSSVKHSLGQFSVAPVLDFERDPTLDTPYTFKNKPTQSPSIQVDRDFNPFKNDFSNEENSRKPHFQKQNSSGWENLYVGLNGNSFENFHSIEVESEVVTGNLFDASEHEISNNCFQLQKKYIVSSLKNGMLVIDQYRAHFRILYEEFLKSITVSAAVSQQLLFPLTMEFDKQETRLLLQLKESLEQTGFVFAEVSEETIQISGIPTSISESEVPRILEKLIADFHQEIPKSGFEQTDLLAKSLAKNMAVKAGTSLAPAEQVGIVNSLFACTEASTDPNNKSTFITITEEDLAKKFI
ncbi:MAG TPA: DNA mismatch repair protein MutL, partial [Flavobacteriaceae bacterium]|nr:DNA mismatch repair protein MutL [Flavobacteriaceae bacterium]